VFENRMLRRILGPKREVAGGWRRLRNEEFNYLYVSPNIIRVIKSRRMRWTRNVAQLREMLVGKLKGRDQSEDLGVDGKIVLECI
jgi:hypothetical protein